MFIDFRVEEHSRHNYNDVDMRAILFFYIVLHFMKKFTNKSVRCMVQPSLHPI